jgi:hypothetical protein
MERSVGRWNGERGKMEEVAGGERMTNGER